jgi:MoaA/NifB/PqqE/SkfB family radical SAM enzyme
MGNSFFGILGGEPFMHPQLLEILERHPDCYFQIFTNGQFITDEIAKKLRKLGNATPLISVEGNEIISNERRGRSDVYNKTMQGIQNCLNNKLLTGVCTSLCKSNIDDLLTEEWVDKLIDMGVMYTWYHIYRVAGPDPNPEAGYFYRSDHVTLARRGVPMLYADSGSVAEEGGAEYGAQIEAAYRLQAYHKPADEFDPNWDMGGFVQSTELVYRVSRRLTDSEDWPNWYEDNEFRAIRDAMMDD